MPNKNKAFSVLYSPSISLSSDDSRSKSISNRKSNRKSNTKNKTKSNRKLKTKSNTRSKSNKRQPARRLSMLDSENVPLRKNTGANIPRPKRNTTAFRDLTNTRRSVLKSKYSPKLSWRKSKTEQLSLKATRDNLSKLLIEQKWENKIEPNDIITIRYNPIREIHIHLYQTSNNKIGYHVKATFPLNRWSLLLQYNTTTNDYDFIVKNEMQVVVMRESWRNKKEAIERLTGFKTILLTKGEANVLMDNMLDIVTIIEKVVKTNVTGGSKNSTKPNTRKHKTMKHKSMKHKSRTHKSKTRKSRK